MSGQLLPVAGAIRNPDDVLTLAQFKAFIVDAPDSEDAEIQQAINSAFEDVEKHTGRAFGLRTYDLVLDCFPSGIIHLRGSQERPTVPLNSVVSVKYNDSAEQEQTLVEGTHFTVHGVNVEDLYSVRELGYIYGGYIRPVDGWPSDVSDKPGSVTIRLVAGYNGTVIKIPASGPQGTRIRTNKYYSFKGASYDSEADKLYWETIQPLIIYSFV